MMMSQNLIKLSLLLCLMSETSFVRNSDYHIDFHKNIPVIEKVETKPMELEFSEEKLIELLKELNVKYPHIVLAQAKLETGHFKSKIFNENNNLFGMKEAKVRIHTAKGTKNEHAYYENWVESVYDYAFYQSTYHSDKKNERQYYKALDKSYAESKNYSETLQKIIDRENLYEVFLVK